jgi:hypothetical protein
MLKSEDRIPIVYKGFLLRKKSNALLLNSNEFGKAAEIMQSDNINHLEVNPNFFEASDLNFLNRFSFITGLTLLNSTIKDISPIELLPDLKILNIEHKLQGYLDFGKFRNLEDCFFTWGLGGSETIFNANSLKSLRIDDYNKYELNEFSALKLLSSLSLYNAKIVNLQGLSSLNLLKLDLTGCSNLEDIKELCFITNLKELRIDNCKNIASLEPIKFLSQLKSLSFNNIGNVLTIDFIKPLTHLEEIFFADDTNIVNGDLNNLQVLYKNGVLKKVIFLHRKHYSHNSQSLGYIIPTVVSDIFKKRN